RQYVGSNHVAGLCEEDREHIWQRTARVGDGSWHSERSAAERHARTRAANFLSGRHTQRQNQPAREEVVGFAVAEGPRRGGSEVVRARGRAVRAGQEPGSAGQGNRHPAQASGPLAAQVARYAQEPTQARPVIAAHRAAKKEAGRAFGFVKIRLPQKDEAVTRHTFSFQVDKAKLKAAQQRDGHYLL